MDMCRDLSTDGLCWWCRFVQVEHDFQCEFHIAVYKWKSLFPFPLLFSLIRRTLGGPVFHTEHMKTNPSWFKLRKWHFIYEGFLSSSILIIWTPVRELWSLSLRGYFDFILLWRILVERAWPSVWDHASIGNDVVLFELGPNCMLFLHALHGPMLGNMWNCEC